MIWRDAVTLEPVAPGSCEDGGVPSITHRWCADCKTERPIYFKDKAGYCEICKFRIMVQT